MYQDTTSKLAAITDPGKFELLATAILREANPDYASLVHPGVNAEGKTVKSPLDGIGYVLGAEPPHMIAVHHTTCERDDLAKKWLHDPSRVKQRRAKKAADVAGDVLKTAHIVKDERTRTPSLRATLVLTTNEEPSEKLVRDVHAAGRAQNIGIDLWHRSRLAHFLNNDPQGQWIRREYFGIEPERLSRDLLKKLSLDSIRLHPPHDNPEAWVDSGLDRIIAEQARNDVMLLVADSGQGKSVACRKRLAGHIASGGFGLFLSDKIIAEALTLDQAIDAALRQLQPSLAFGSGSDALQMASAQRPLLLVVEDISRSGQPPVLLQRLAAWSQGVIHDASPQNYACQILCPVWPQVLASLNEDAFRRIQPLMIGGAPFSAEDGRHAVQRRSSLKQLPVSDLDADAISNALGHDPLLIALHEPGKAPEPIRVIAQFVDRNVIRSSAADQHYTASDYRDALRTVARAMLARLQLNPPWRVVREWLHPLGDALPMLRQLTHDGDIVRLEGPASDQRLAFRHDRVRDWLLTDAAAEMIRTDTIDDDQIAEPYFAEVIGTALLQDGIDPRFVERIRRLNPLALFHALRLFREPANDRHRAVLAAIDAWLTDEATHAPSNQSLRWEAMAALSETESSTVVGFTQRFREQPWIANQALFRNGNLIGGLRLCGQVEPGMTAPWRDRQIEHVKLRYGNNLTQKIAEMLKLEQTTNDTRIGALRLAGYIADPALADGIETCWASDRDRDQHLRDYLWAAAECCGNNPDRLLDPICDAWATLSNEPENEHSQSPREDLAAHELRWAFQHQIPTSAINYFVKRAERDDLRWPITLLLHTLDHPEAVEFTARQLAAIDQKVSESGGFSPFSDITKTEWSRGQEESGRPMSKSSKARLLGLWQNPSAEKHLKEESFRLWASTQSEGDLDVLRPIDISGPLGTIALWQRLIRRDAQAIPALIERLQADGRAHWWQMGRYIWSNELTVALDNEFTRRGATAQRACGAKFETDWITYEMVMRLPSPIAEDMLLKHWEHLQYSAYFVQTALYVATPRLSRLAAEAVAAFPPQPDVFEHLRQHFGLRIRGHPGVTRIEQIEALLPYLNRLSDLAISDLWELCTRRGWLDFRHANLDKRLRIGREVIYLDDDKILQSLDSMIDNHRHHWIGLWIADFLKTGASVDRLMGMFAKWLSRRCTIASYQLTASAVIHIGRRKDLYLLRMDGIEPAIQAASIFANTSYAVRRRTLL